MSWLLPAAAVAVALGEAGHDRGAVGGRWLGQDDEMPGDAEEGIGIEMLPLVLSLAIFNRN